MNSLARLACCRLSFSLRNRQGYRVFPIVSSYLIGQQLRIVTGIKMDSRGQANGSDRHDEHGDSGKRPTRSEVKQKEKDYRDRFIHMPLEDKRKLYKCKKKFKMLEDIPTWNDYYHKNKENLLKKLGKMKTKPLYEVNEVINRKISIWKGDITTLEIDAIVNAANSSLLGGGGVDGAIHEAAGKKLFEECRTLQGCSTGEAKITAGYKLPARYVIHTVGPIGEKDKLLRKAYENSLNVMMENKLRSVALPCISTGIYGYDNQKACHVALKVVREFMTKNADSVDRVIFCLFLPKDVDLYEENLQIYFPVEITENNTESTSSDVVMATEAETFYKSKKDGFPGKEHVKVSESKESNISSEENDGTDQSEEKSQQVKQKETVRSEMKAKALESNISSEEKDGTDQSEEKSQQVKQKETVRSGIKAEALDKTVTSTDVEMKETESSVESNNRKGKAKDSESEGKEKTYSNAVNDKSTETRESKKGKENSLTKGNTESPKAKDKEDHSGDVEMKDIESTVEPKQKTKGSSGRNEKAKASKSKGSEKEAEKNGNSDKEPDGKQPRKCDSVQSSRM